VDDEINSAPVSLELSEHRIKVGIAGSPYEVGLDAAKLSLDLQMQANAAAIMTCKSACPMMNRAQCQAKCDTDTVFQFLRRDAYLYLIFVTDEEDRSSQDVRFFYRYFETVKGVGNDGMVTTAAIMGDVPSNSCGATPGTRYKTLSDLTGGEVGSICDTNFSTTLTKLAKNAVGLKRKFALQVKPNLQTLQVKLRYPCNVAADQLAGCASVDRTACMGNPADSTNLVCTPKQGAPDGWEVDVSVGGARTDDGPWRQQGGGGGGVVVGEKGGGPRAQARRGSRGVVGLTSPPACRRAGRTAPGCRRDRPA
jgi:hypothetical protein